MHVPYHTLPGLSHPFFRPNIFVVLLPNTCPPLGLGSFLRFNLPSRNLAGLGIFNITHRPHNHVLRPVDPNKLPRVVNLRCCDPRLGRPLRCPPVYPFCCDHGNTTLGALPNKPITPSLKYRLRNHIPIRQRNGSSRTTMHQLNIVYRTCNTIVKQIRNALTRRVTCCICFNNSIVIQRV